MFRLSRAFIAFACVFCFLCASPQVFACPAPSPYGLLLDIAPESPPDADIIAEVIFEDMKFTTPFAISNATHRTIANIVRVLKTSDGRVREGEKIIMKYEAPCGPPSPISGTSGVIAARVVTDIDGHLVLCPYSYIYSTGEIVPPHISACDLGKIEAAKQIKLAAENGDVKAQIALGAMYEYGVSYARIDNAEAMKWFRLAAESGDAEAQYNFGIKTHSTATEMLKWFELAAAQGHTEAMLSIGWMYEYDKSGIKQSEAEAEKWYRLAAEKGNERAEYRLKTLKEKQERNKILGICILSGVVVTIVMVLRRLISSKPR